MSNDNPVSWLMLTLLVSYLIYATVKAAIREKEDLYYEYLREERKKW